MFLDWADLDNDGLEDVLVAVREGPILFHRRVSNEPVLWETYSIDLPAGAGTGKSVAVGDIDLDGKTDLVFSSENASDDKHGVMWLSYDVLSTPRFRLNFVSWLGRLRRPGSRRSRSEAMRSEAEA
jgi:hypothetical protein